jgi:hypothetical protein
MRDFRFQISGSGSERAWLERHLPRAEFTGVLSGEALAAAYANMDVFAFPSHTDTFGNVVQEALASGVPAVVTASGGPRFIVRDGVSGFVAESDDDFCEPCAARWAVRRACKWKINPGTASLRRCMEPMSAQSVASEPRTVTSAAFDVLSHPWRVFVLNWNWKTALLSAVIRIAVWPAALAGRARILSLSSLQGALIEFVFRLTLGGCWGSLLQSFSTAQPAWLAGLCVSVVLPAASHALEYLLLRATGTAHAGAVVITSVVFSILSVLINWGLMRRGILLTGDGTPSFADDLRRISDLIPTGNVLRGPAA